MSYIIGHYEPLEVLLRMYKAFQHSQLSPDTRDDQGNTLFHLAAAAPYSKHALKVVQTLCRNHFNPNLWVVSLICSLHHFKRGIDSRQYFFKILLIKSPTCFSHQTKQSGQDRSPVHHQIQEARQAYTVHQTTSHPLWLGASLKS